MGVCVRYVMPCIFFCLDRVRRQQCMTWNHSSINWQPGGLGRSPAATNTLETRASLGRRNPMGEWRSTGIVVGTTDWCRWGVEEMPLVSIAAYHWCGRENCSTAIVRILGRWRWDRGRWTCFAQAGTAQMPWRPWRYKREQHVTSCAWRITVRTPAIFSNRGDVQQRLSSYDGNTTVNIPTVCRDTGHVKSRGVAAPSPQ